MATNNVIYHDLLTLSLYVRKRDLCHLQTLLDHALRNREDG